MAGRSRARSRSADRGARVPVAAESEERVRPPAGATLAFSSNAVQPCRFSTQSHPMCPDIQQPADTPSNDQEADFDLVFPAIPPLASEVLSVAGEAALRGLVRRHHERLRGSSIGDRFPADVQRFDAVVERIANFIVDTARGSPPHVPSRARTWLRSRHLPITIDEPARNVWLAELLAAFDDVDFPPAARSALWSWLEALSIVIINRRTMMSQPCRYLLADAPAALRPFQRSGQRS